jgi:hypothetical protein
MIFGDGARLARIRTPISQLRIEDTALVFVVEARETVAPEFENARHPADVQCGFDERHAETTARVTEQSNFR